jgi:hypothetical protein
MPMGTPGGPPYRVELTTEPRAVEPGMMVRLLFRIAHPTTHAAVTDLQIVHEKPFHLFLVSDDLEIYQHLHPALGGADGSDHAGDHAGEAGNAAGSAAAPAFEVETRSAARGALSRVLRLPAGGGNAASRAADADDAGIPTAARRPASGASAREPSGRGRSPREGRRRHPLPSVAPAPGTGRGSGARLPVPPRGRGVRRSHHGSRAVSRRLGAHARSRRGRERLRALPSHATPPERGRAPERERRAGRRLQREARQAGNPQALVTVSSAGGG